MITLIIQDSEASILINNHHGILIVADFLAKAIFDKKIAINKINQINENIVINKDMPIPFI